MAHITWHEVLIFLKWEPYQPSCNADHDQNQDDQQNKGALIAPAFSYIRYIILKIIWFVIVFHNFLSFVFYF